MCIWGLCEEESKKERKKEHYKKICSEIFLNLDKLILFRQTYFHFIKCFKQSQCKVVKPISSQMLVECFLFYWQIILLLSTNEFLKIIIKV